MASIRERSPGVHQIRAYVGRDEAGAKQYITETFRGGKREAKARANELETGVTNRELKPIRRQSAGQTLEDFLSEWLEYIEEVREWSYVRNARSHMKVLCAVKVGDKPLGKRKLTDLTGEDLDRAYSAMQKKGVSVSTVATRHRVLRGALNVGKRWRRLRSNPCDETSPLRVHHLKPKAIKPEHVAAMLRAAEERNPILAAAIALAAVLGTRRGELCGIRWSDIDEEIGELAIERAVKHGRSMRQADLVAGDPKTHRSRDFNLSAFALIVLNKHRAYLQELAAAFGTTLDPEAYVLVPTQGSPSFDPTGRTPMRPDYLTRAFTRLRDRLGYKTLTMQSLRRFAATTMNAHGIDPVTGAELLGHDPAIYFKHYASSANEARQAAVEVLGGVLARELGMGDEGGPVDDVAAADLEAPVDLAALGGVVGGVS